MMNPRVMQSPWPQICGLVVLSSLAPILVVGYRLETGERVDSGGPRDVVVKTVDQDQDDLCQGQPSCPSSLDSAKAPAVAAPPHLLDVPLRTHRGDDVHFYSDLVRGKVVAINFVFTTCKGVCPSLGANFAALSLRMRDRPVKDFALISVSVDPVNDGPEQLAEWSRGFKRDPAWTLVTGEKRNVDRLLKALGVYSADKLQHSPFILIGDEESGTWSRLYGLTAPEKVAEALETLLDHRAPAHNSESRENAAARHYFSDVELVCQDGQKRRLYTDLMRGKVVVVQSFFCSCKAACPALVSNFTAIQKRFENRMGKDLHLLSISVDPEMDTPAKLKEYADRIGAGPGWFFLTGPKKNVNLALLKFGQKVESRDNHSNLFIVGNEATGLWKKAMGLSAPESLIEIVAGVLDDPGSPSEEEGDGG